ncbi:hypothetical protein [Okeania sp. SIO2B3]|nr:hypothetical protein [Okeania sp. SIO2B3]NET45921.1 hypothetical protein [Okeania sp. SIO2B3]
MASLKLQPGIFFRFTFGNSKKYPQRKKAIAFTAPSLPQIQPNQQHLYSG